MHLRRIGVTWLIVCAFLATCAMESLGQGFQSRYANAEAILLPPPREIESLLEDAKDSIRSKQWNEATVALGIILGIDETRTESGFGEDYFILEPTADQPVVQGSIIQEAHRLLAELPEEGRKVVELRYGVQASQMLEKAIQSSDWGAIEEIACKYRFTRAGQDALLLNAEKLIAEGNPAQAAISLERLLELPFVSDRLGASLGAMTVASYLAAGMPTQARKTLATARRAFPTATLDWNGSKIGWNERTTDEAILQSLGGEPVQTLAKKISKPAYPGGNPMRNADTRAGLPLPILRWHVELHESFQHKDNLDRAMKKLLADRKSVLIPTRYPIASGDWILAPTYDQRILAIDAKTGRIGWPCVFSGMPLGFSLDRFAGRDGFSLGMPAPDYLVKRVWGETSVGQIAAYGERLYSLSELPAVDVAESFAQGPNARLARNLGARNFNVLQCWSIADQGKLLWETGGSSGGNAPDLAGALFLGAPLPSRGELLVLVELNGEIFLVALGPADGKLRWKQPIAANQGTTISLDPQRRSYGASPAADGSVVVCPTLSGFLVAFDTSTRELLWQYRYNLNPNLNQNASFNFIGGMDARESNPTVPRSVETSVLLHQGVAVFAPPNGNTIAGISMADGKELWQVAFDDPTPFRYVGGAWEDTLALVQTSTVSGVEIQSGKPKWSPIALPNDGLVVGRSVRQGKWLFVPTSTQEIVQIDLEKGELAGSVRVERPLGNLVAVDDRLISASPFELDCYSIRDAFQTKLLDELKKDGESVRSLVKQGELEIAAGNIDAALSTLEKARGMSPSDPDVRLLLVKVGTLALKTDFDKYVDRVQQYQEMTLDLDLPSYLRILIHGLEKQSRWEESLIKLLELSDTRVHRRIDQMSDGQDIDMSSKWTVQEDRWIATHIARCANQLTEDAWTRVGPQVQQRVDATMSRDRGILRLRLEHFQSLQQAEPLRIAAATALMRSSPIEAERILRQGTTAELTPDQLSGPRRELLCELYLRSNRMYLAFRYAKGDNQLIRTLLEKIVSETRPFTIPNEIDASQVAQFMEIANRLNAKQDWPEGALDVSVEFLGLNAVRPFEAISDASSLCPISEWVGDAFQDWQVFYNASGFQFMNQLTGEQFQQMIDAGGMERSTVPRIYAVDSLVLIELRNQLIAVDTLQALTSQQDGQLWRNSFGDDFQDVQERGRGRANIIERNVWGLPVQRRSFRVAAVARSGAIVLHNDELSCLDLFTGNRLWSVEGFRNASFVREENVLHVFQPSTGQIVSLDLRDGLTLKSLDAQQSGWIPLATIGKRWLFSPERQSSGDKSSEMRLRLVEPSTGAVLLERAHTVDTRLALVDDVGVAALSADGTFVYWNGVSGVEHEYDVEVEGKFAVISAQVFGDTALVMPYAPSMELEPRIVVNPSPRNDPSVAACAGRLFAISVEDGHLLWERTQRVKHFLFPLSQSRESPVAIFFRRLSLTKVLGQNVDLASIALIDVKTGRLLYMKNDLQAMRGEAFRQQLDATTHAMIVKYLGNTLNIRWTGNQEGLAPLNQVDEVGDLDPEEFRKQVEEMLKSSSSARDLE